MMEPSVCGQILQEWVGSLLCLSCSTCISGWWAEWGQQTEPFCPFLSSCFSALWLGLQTVGNQNLKPCDNLRRLTWTFRQLNRIKKASLIDSTCISTYQAGRTHATTKSRMPNTVSQSVLHKKYGNKQAATTIIFPRIVVDATLTLTSRFSAHLSHLDLLPYVQQLASIVEQATAFNTTAMLASLQDYPQQESPCVAAFLPHLGLHTFLASSSAWPIARSTLYQQIYM